MSLVNQALQKVRALEAQQHAANGPGGAVFYHISPPRGIRFGLMAMMVGTMLLGGVVLGAWLGGIRLNDRQNGQSSLLPKPASARGAVALPTTEDGRLIDTVKPPDAPTAAVEVTQFPSISLDTKPPAPADAAPPAAQATTPATQVAEPAIGHEAVAAVPAMVEAEAAPAALPPAPAAPVPAKGPVLVNPQTLDVPGSNKLRLMGCSHTLYGTRAVINNTIVEEGDQIESATVVRIEGKHVQLKIDQKTFTLQMP